MRRYYRIDRAEKKRRRARRALRKLRIRLAEERYADDLAVWWLATPELLDLLERGGFLHMDMWDIRSHAHLVFAEAEAILIELGLKRAQYSRRRPTKLGAK